MDPRDSENELAVRAKTDEQAFAQLYERYLPKLFGFVTRRINNRHEAEDIVSQIFMRVVEHIKNFDPKKSSFKCWLYTIATRLIIDYIRTRVPKQTADLEHAEVVSDPVANPQHDAMREEDKSRVHKAITELPERHQQVILLKYFSDLSVEEIASVLGVTSNNASVIIHRALSAFETTYQRYV